MNKQKEDDHIVMFPFMAQGHIIPFLALAKLFSQRKPNIKITLVSTPLNIKYLAVTLASETKYKNICLAQLPFSGPEHGLPPNCENTDSLPPHLIVNLFYASESLKPSFDSLINEIITTERRVPSCVISDVFLGWVNETAKRVGTLHFSFTTCGGYGTAAYFSICLYLPHRKKDGSNDLIEEFHVPKFPDTCRLHISQLPVYIRETNKDSPSIKLPQKHISLSQKSDGMICNTIEEIEVLGLGALRKHLDSKPVWAIGPLLPQPFLLGHETASESVASNLRTGKEYGISPDSCIQWLNPQKPSSVVYISFGSQSTITASNMMELALGLENSGNCFIWVLRPPKEFDIKSEFRSEWLPEGFVERMKESQKGFLVKNWAPQLEILSHKSTGAFLSHCGWNSVLESLSQGVPIIGWPLEAEQAYNSKMMEDEMGVCIELSRLEGQVVSEDVKKIIEQVMNSTNGEEIRKKARVIGEKIRAAMTEDKGDYQKGSSVRSVDDFLATITSKKVEA